MSKKEQRGRQHVEAWRASGQTQKQYCDQHGLSRSTLAYWSSKINSEIKPSDFVEIHHDGRAPAAGGVVELVVNDRYRLRIGEGFSAEAVKRLLDVIEHR